MNLVQSKLPNGLPVLFVETETFPSFTALLLVGAGSRFESKQNNGIAHFFEHMAFKGSKRYPDSLTIASTIEGLGGVFNAYTDRDHTGYWIKAPTEHYETVLDVLSDMLLDSLLQAEEIEREKGVILEEMNMYEDSPARKVGDVLQELMYGGTPLGLDILGTRESIKNTNRQTFLDYMNTWYKPGNAVLTIAGGFKNSPFAASYMDIASQKFGGWASGEVSKLQPIDINQTRSALKIKSKKTEQAHFTLGFRSFKNDDPRRYALALLATILGAGMSSRLFIQVRERRGLCYYISTHWEFYEETGDIVTQAGVTNNKDKVMEAVQATLKEYTAMRNGEFTEEELARAKALMKGRFIMSMEDSHSIAEYYGIRKLFNMGLFTPEELLARYDAVTKEEIVDVARYCFTPEKMNFAVIGPFTDNDFQIEYNI